MATETLTRHAYKSVLLLIGLILATSVFAAETEGDDSTSLNCLEESSTGNSTGNQKPDCPDPDTKDSPPEVLDHAAKDATPFQSRDEASVAISENTQSASLLREFLGERQVIFFGRLEVEAANYDILALTGDGGPDLRRFRLGWAGVQPWFPRISYKVEFDLGSNDFQYSSIYVRFDGKKRGTLTVGNQDVTQNLSANTGSLSQLFMEAPLPANAFSLTKRLSAAWDWTGKRSMVHAMIFGKDPNTDVGYRGVAARGVYSPYRSENGIWHFGGSVVLEKVRGRTNLSSRPESHVTDVRFLDTGDVYDVEDRYAYSVELAGASGPFSGRLELFRTDWHRADGRKNRFLGAYWEGGYFLTGQSFRYRLGKFIRPALTSGSPAWELGLRLSWADLNDGDIQGGEQRNAGIALNVYPLPNVRGQFNLLQVNSDQPGGDGLVAQARLQWNW